LVVPLHPTCKKEKTMRRVIKLKVYGPVGLNPAAPKTSKLICTAVAFKLIDNYTVIQQTSVTFIP
jgi:hypothetical protein